MAEWLALISELLNIDVWNNELFSEGLLADRVDLL